MNVQAKEVSYQLLIEANRILQVKLILDESNLAQNVLQLILNRKFNFMHLKNCFA